MPTILKTQQEGVFANDILIERHAFWRSVDPRPAQLLIATGWKEIDFNHALSLTRKTSGILFEITGRRYFILETS